MSKEKKTKILRLDSIENILDKENSRSITGKLKRGLAMLTKIDDLNYSFQYGASAQGMPDGYLRTTEKIW